MRNGMPSLRRMLTTAAATTAVGTMLGLAPSLLAQGLPTFSKSFDPSTIGPGSTSTLRFDIANATSSPVLSLAFTDSLPSGVTLATPANPISTCGGSVSAADGGSTVSLSGGSLGGSSSCSVSVNVTSATPGSHVNTTGDLTSSAGNSGSATATLTVDTSRPGFSKSFSPSSVLFGGRSTLTFTIDNTANASQIFNPNFVDNLPAGLKVASPTNAINTCGGGTLSATAGGSSIALSGFSPTPVLAAGASCTLSVDVVGSAVGVQNNVSGDLTSTSGGPTADSGKATAALTVNADRLLLTKEFVDDPVAPGGQVDLLFTLLNRDRSGTATGIAFTDDLDAALSGLTVASLPSVPCGAGSSLSGSSVLSLSSGSLAAGSSCSFTVTLDVPSGATPGSYTNTTSTVDAAIGGSPVGGAAASDTLFVAAVPLLTKTFLDNPATGGDTVTMEFSITNTSPTSSATDLAFTDVLSDFLTTVTVSSLPSAGFCGGAIASVPLIGALPTLVVSGASLAAGASCTFSVDLVIAVSEPAGPHVNTTSAITATIDGQAVAGPAATDTLDIVVAPKVSKTFTDDPVAAGDTVTLQFSLSNPEEATGTATDIAFTDDLSATLAGLTAVGLPLSNVCGAGSSISGTTNLSFSGGTLAPGESCVFDVTLQVPSSALPGSYTNTTSNSVANIDGVPAVGNFGTDDLDILGLSFTKSFVDDPVVPGETVDLQFTIENTTPALSATGLNFQDNVGSVLSNLAATGLPLSDICGTGSSLVGLSGGKVLVFSGGSLAPGTSCTFTVTLQVPSSADPGTYVNATSNLFATIGGNTAIVAPAHDILTVASDLLMLTKEFTNDPVAPGGSVNLEFVVTNTADREISSIAFDDDLDAALSGLVSTSGTVADVCGTGSQITGTSTLSLTGGTLAAGASCTFSVTVVVPSSALASSAINTTSQVTGNLMGLFPVVGDPATDELLIGGLDFSKSFSGPANAGGTVQLTFNIQNPNPTLTATRVAFSDDLSAVLSGLMATGLPASDVCGTGSVLAGTSFLTLTDGLLLPGGSCTFSATLQVPASAVPGDYLNITSDLEREGILAAAPATATLTIEEVTDSDGDGVLDSEDLCPNTVIPEGVPTDSLGKNRFALVDGDGIFDTNPPNGHGPNVTFTIEDTAGCSCEQIIAAAGLGQGHVKFGCSKGAMEDWIGLVNP